jgi:hypothetical protein
MPAWLPPGVRGDPGDHLRVTAAYWITTGILATECVIDTALSPLLVGSDRRSRICDHLTPRK